MSVKTAAAAHPILPLLAERWSPRAFADRAIARTGIESLFEAARWSPSGGNTQPWSFIIATLDDTEAHEPIASTLNPGNAWARKAPLLGIGVAKTELDNGRHHRHAYYDLGLAMMALSIQAQSMGLYVHQMAGFSPDKAREVLAIPEKHDAVIAFAAGYLGDPAVLSDDLKARELAPRVRKPLAEFLFRGKWGQTI